MPQSLSQILVHLVFSTKDRMRTIADSVRGELHGYMVGIFRDLEAPSLLINSVEDHVHALFLLSRTRTLADVIEEVKRGSSKWLKLQGREYRDFHWQNGYGAFSIGQSQVEAVKTYIENQREHHAKLTFQEEFRKLLEKYQVPYDERYVWD